MIDALEPKYSANKFMGKNYDPLYLPKQRLVNQNGKVESCKTKTICLKMLNRSVEVMIGLMIIYCRFIAKSNPFHAKHSHLIHC